MPVPTRSSTSSFSSPLPRPNILDEPLTFSTKKARSTPRFRPPPRPPAKTCPPVSRVFKRRPSDLLGKQAQSVTFKDSPDGSLTGTPLQATAVYDATRPASYYEQTFDVEEKLGAGYFGTVYRVRNKGWINQLCPQSFNFKISSMGSKYSRGFSCWRGPWDELRMNMKYVYLIKQH